MVLATYTSAPLTAPFTIAQLSSALQTAMLNAGFPSTPHDDLGGNGFAHEVVFDAAKTRGKVYHQTRFSTSGDYITIYQSLHGGWNLGTNTGEDSGQEQDMGTIDNTVALMFYSFNHPEVKYVLIEQSGSFYHVDLWRPANKLPGLYDEDTYPYGFITQSDLYRFYSCAANLSPYITSNSPSYADQYQISNISSGNVTYKNTLLGKHVVELQPKLYTETAEGAAAQFSEDLAIIGVYDNTENDAITTTVSGSQLNYKIIGKNGNVGIALATDLS